MIKSVINGENVEIVATNISRDFANFAYVDSSGNLKVSRKYISINDEATIATSANTVSTIDYKLYETYSSIPSGTTIGQEVKVRRLLGPGYFKCSWTGTRWEVCTGEAIVSDISDTTYTAASSATYNIKQCTIPPNLISEGELWEGSMLITLSAGSVDSGSTWYLNLGPGNLWFNSNAVPGVPYTFDVWNRRFRRVGTRIKRGSMYLTDGYLSVEADFDTDLSQPQIFSASVTPKIGNVYNCSKLWMARIG